MKDLELEKTIQSLIEQKMKQTARPRYGIVLSYNRQDNTATVLLTSPDSDKPGDIYPNVLCPTNLGIQSSEPEMGRPCWVEFSGPDHHTPVITHFFHSSYRDMEYQQQYRATNDIPRFMMEL